MNSIHYSQRIKLRSFLENDIESIYRYRSLPEIARYQYWEPFTMERTKDFFYKCSNPDLDKDDQWIGLAIEYKSNVIGDCAFNISGNTVEIGCNISPEHQGMGFAKEALYLIITYCFKCRGVNEIIGITDSRNTASIKLMESLVMSKVPNFENRIVCKGEECIEYKYSGKKDSFNISND